MQTFNSEEIVGPRAVTGNATAKHSLRRPAEVRPSVPSPSGTRPATWTAPRPGPSSRGARTAATASASAPRACASAQTRLTRTCGASSAVRRRHSCWVSRHPDGFGRRKRAGGSAPRGVPGHRHRPLPPGALLGCSPGHGRARLSEILFTPHLALNDAPAGRGMLGPRALRTREAAAALSPTSFPRGPCCPSHLNCLFSDCF